MQRKFLLLAAAVMALALPTLSSTAVGPDTTALRNAVTVAGVMQHEQALQAIANANGGTRASGDTRLRGIRRLRRRSPDRRGVRRHDPELHLRPVHPQLERLPARLAGPEDVRRGPGRRVLAYGLLRGRATSRRRLRSRVASRSPRPAARPAAAPRPTTPASRRARSRSSSAAPAPSARRPRPRRPRAPSRWSSSTRGTSTRPTIDSASSPGTLDPPQDRPPGHRDVLRGRQELYNRITGGQSVRVRVAVDAEVNDDCDGQRDRRHTDRPRRPHRRRRRPPRLRGRRPGHQRQRVRHVRDPRDRAADGGARDRAREPRAVRLLGRRGGRPDRLAALRRHPAASATSRTSRST